jgi:hypothetical protein
VVFLDGHGRPESRLFPAVVGFYPLSLVATALAVRRPLIGLALVAGTALTAASIGLARGKRREDVIPFAALAPVYAAAHGIGMWRGLVLMVADRIRLRRTA